MFQSSDAVTVNSLFNEEVMESRITELDKLLQSTGYAKQKSKLQMELESFLSCLNPPKTLLDASPSDIQKFLVFKDSHGKTQVHILSCEHRGKKGQFGCNCPLRLSAGSVDSLIGKIRAIYRDNGRGCEWNPSLVVSNPAAAPGVKHYLKAIKLEQSLSAVTPKQAVPLFTDKLSMMSRHISFSLGNPKNAVLQKYILQRDMTFFNVLSYSGDRAGDLGGLLANQVCFLPDDAGLVFSLTHGKTINVTDPRVVIVFFCYKAEFCPATLLLNFIRFCNDHGFLRDSNYVFRTLADHNNLSKNPFSSSAANARLRFYLEKLNLWKGETPHSTRGACAVMLSHLNVSSESIKAHIGWKSDKILQHYTRSKELDNKRNAASALSNAEMSEHLDLVKRLDLYKGVSSFKQVLQ